MTPANIVNTEAKVKISRYKIAGAIGFLIVICIAILFFALLSEKNSHVLLDISYWSDNKTHSDHTESKWQLVADTDKVSVLRISKNLEITIEPHLNAENKRIDVMTYKTTNGKREPIGSLQPVSLVNFDDPFVIRHESSGTDTPDIFEVEIIVSKF